MLKFFCLLLRPFFPPPIVDYSDDFEVYDSLEEQTGHAWRETGEKDEEEADEDLDLEDVSPDVTIYTM